MLTLHIDKSSYWKTCNGDNTQREAQTLDVLRSAVNGEIPQWFADTYTDSEGEVDLEHLWTDVQDLPGRDWNVVIFQLRNAFGGYCNNELTWTSVEYSDETLTQPWMDGGCPPPEPSSLEVTPGNGELTLAWDAPASDGEFDVDGYIVQWRSGYQFYYGWAARQRRAVLDSPTSLTYTISALTNGVEYDVRVRAYNHIGPGQPLDVEGVTPSEAAIPQNTPATGAPTISGTAQVGETLTANTSGIADADGLSNVQYEYQWLADDTDIAGATGSTYTLADTDEGKAIKVRVSFTDYADNEETLTSAQPTEPPAKPRGLEATTATHDSVTLTWDGPQDDTISGYVILRRIPGVDPEGHFNVLVADTGTAATTYTDDTVSAETRYTYRIKAINGAGTSERSRWSHIDVPAAPVPDKPTGLEATESDGQVVLTWDDPGDDSITGYVILRRIPGVDPEGHFDVLVANTGTAATTYTDDTVSAETRYTYRIKAINGAGTSERSRWSHIDTPAAPVPNKPTGLEATESHGQVVLTWDDPGDDSITGYVILRRVRENNTGGDFDVLVADTGTAALTYTDATVVAGTTYTYRIKAINEHGTSERSRWFHIDIPEAP